MRNKEKNNARTERRDAAENRQRILDAALRLFEENGVEPVSMNQIAIEAQIGAGTLYRRYRNKSELCLDLIRDNLDLLFEDMDAYLEQHRDDPPGRRLKGILRLFIRFREKKLQLLAGVEEGASPSRPKNRSPNPMLVELQETFARLFGEMSASEPSEPENVFKADMLLMALKSEFYVFQKEVRAYSSEQFLERLCSALFPTAGN
ncbi:TetR family transcriptional regulator [Cohnella zeiphila]|uniref:TetR/AcrR family transcriptional regulator n=1 Tax=Cohnella zeiphila TaxID=2761120 RepID=A0A7X0SKA2_9BACL|nr:TetR/AcrR family transcriptional regulator [Cohnella zeiphila]